MESSGSSSGKTGDTELRVLLTSPGGRWRNLPAQLASRPDREAIVTELVRLSDWDSEVEVRYRAKKILAALGCAVNRSRPAAPAASPGAPPGGASADAGSAPIPLGALAAAMADCPADERRAILEGFLGAHRSAGVAELLAWLPREEDVAVIASAISHVGAHGSPAHLRELKPYLAHPNPRVVANTVEAAGRLDAGAALPMVLPLLLTDDNRLRGNLVMVLWKSARPQVLAYLSRMATSFKEAYRAAAIWCMGQIDDPEIEEILVAAFVSEESPQLMAREAELLERLGTKRCIPQLHRISELHAGRKDLAGRIIEAVAEREGMGDDELSSFLESLDADPPRGRLGRAVRRLTRMTRSLRARLSRRVRPIGATASRSMSVMVPEDRRADPRPAMGAVCVVALVLGALALRGGGAAPTPGAGHPTMPVGAAQPAARPSLPSGGLASIRGRVMRSDGEALTLEREHTLYFVRFATPAALAGVRPGDRVQVEGHYVGWNTFHGYGRLEGSSAVVLR